MSYGNIEKMGASIIGKIKDFGIIPIGVASFSRIMRKIKLPKHLINSYVNWKNRYLSRWLWKRFSYIVVEEEVENQEIYENYVFVFWLQGEQQAPPIVKACLASIRQWCADRQVVVLDKTNYMKYATLPDSLVLKWKTGEIV